VQTLSLRSHGVSHEVGRELARRCLCRSSRGSLVHREIGCLPVSVQAPRTRSTVRQAWPAWFHPSLCASPLQSSFASDSARALSGRAHCQGFCPLRDITGRVHSLPRGFQPSLRSVLRRSQPLDGFLRAPALGLVSSPSRVQGIGPFRGFSLRAARRLVAVDCPLAVGLALLGANLPARPSTAAPPRLRGFAPRGDIVRVVR